MKFGIFANLAGPGRHDEFDKVLDEAREQAVYCDKAGYDSIWYTEHHFGHEGNELIPNPILMGADIAARTKRIRIGQAANVITFWHPLRLAEDIAMLDQMSGGRVDIGLARGLYGREAANLNDLADPKNQEQNRALFEETLDILKKALSDRFFSHKGRFYNFPPEGLKWSHPMSPPSSEFMDMEKEEINKIALTPRPYQTPHPPLWQVIDSPRSIKRAAEQGINGIFWMPTVKELKQRFELYRAILSASRGKEATLGEGLALVRDVYVADTMEQAREDAAEAVLNNYRWVCHWRGLGNLMDPGEDPAGKELTYDFLHPRNLLFGTPEYVSEKIQELHDELNVQNLLLWVNHNGLGHDKIMKSLNLFTEKVMPKFKETTFQFN
ncbi:alkanesulfonate monooxygenase SsuD/methylene tetrahydromethanopterin reductase-like flavin-dependent oxidoreductase (luciferase family) [Scopulibacillus darangshiensis]|uniref:Alkanesulfonate monooxygenase SsuD/methylene tetrahydromethanopterin reductase-like flavin-dependent oxidoreductase (Luciferase family) n=1 Tax=Scopulibacillus darangshiensis TaxID=442528 RepID=A0A4R2NST4_9BACL|nr:LLM class flavin-dependent oxidoreductase [Scopulibacillus darangshiensis]TCP24960.1 alkanesulfonate monooxygenase SsuD/methylene tetrahydromethanopterin reductase-like flavin-dependent oxidoreductase (luciferase family) [Scopulibacillus darangshiensis]